MGILRFGPSGGNGGRYFEDGPGENDLRIARVRARHGALVDGFQISYLHNLGNNAVAIVERPWRGSDTNGRAAEELLLQDGEYIEEISGRYGQLIDYLYIRTNRGQERFYGSPKQVGGDQQHPFYYSAPTGTQIVGIIGASGQALDAIGMLLYVPDP